MIHVLSSSMEEIRVKKCDLKTTVGISVLRVLKMK
jgi:hypothetical protein